MMTSPSLGKHVGTGPNSDQPAIPEPAFAERARTLMYATAVSHTTTNIGTATQASAWPLSKVR
jgi:hypothetical protein